MSAAALIALLPTLASTIRNGVSLIKDLKPVIADLFNRGEITAEQQQELMDTVDDILSNLSSGNVPDHWKRQPDPEV